MVLEGVKEMLTTALKTGNDKKKPKTVDKDRFWFKKGLGTFR